MATIAQQAYLAGRAALKQQRERFTKARAAEHWYAIQLRKIASQVGTLASIYDPEDPETLSILEDALYRYARVVKPWATNTAIRMIADVAKRDEAAWAEHGRQIGRALRQEIQTAPTGAVMQSLLNEQVTLITSIPLEAAARVHQLALAGITEGARGKSIVDMVMATGEVTKSRATLIARTETSRTAATLTQARAQHIGSEGYIWRSSEDADVRPGLGIKNFATLNTLAKGSHRKLNGTFQRWDSPPIAGTKGERAHAGCIYNCRCYAEVVF